MTASKATEFGPHLNLRRGWSLEMTARDVEALYEASGDIPPGTRINLTFLRTEDHASRLAAAAAIRERGFIAVPHISARRLRSQDELEELLVGLGRVGAAEHVFVVGGDPSSPEGPFEDAVAVLRTGVLQAHGVRDIGIAGYPGGHPDIADEALWAALEAKAALLAAEGIPGSVVTQFAFDAQQVLDYAAAVRARGIDLPLRVGVPGPAGIKRLLSFAKRFGVATSGSIARKYGLSLTNLLGTAGPDRFLRDLEAEYDPARHGQVLIHYYTFGGLATTARWIAAEGVRA